MVVIRGEGGGGRQRVKGIEYMIMEGDKTLGGEHYTVYRCHIIKLYTWNVYNVTNDVTPQI